MHKHLCDLLRQDAALMQALRAIRSLNLPDAWLGAGAIRNRVWDHLHGFSTPAGGELDVVYFDVEHCGPGFEQMWQARLQAICPGWVWEVTNQAGVHSWRCTPQSPMPPLRSTLDGVSGWPETATALAVRLDEQAQMHVLAPCGLQDLFDLVLRHNPRQVAYDVFLQRLEQKQFLQRWPMLTIQT
ncbi:nucleotidyltransferase family protein [Massilia sp. W12]|uniref:nucleotidyltransferase family protein n=1 Tax=Massilia sp. W12 TaxID=3126507 RepID=UPI0030CECA69